MYNRHRSCITEKDFILYSDTRHNSTAPTKGADAEILPNNTWSYNPIYGAAHVNDTESNKKGGFVIPLGYLKKGDTVKVRAEFMYVSGAKPRISIDRHLTALDGNPQETLRSVVTIGLSQFEEIEIEVIANKDAYYSLYVGTTTAEIGEFYVRNIECNIKSVITEERPYRKNVKAVSIRTTATGVFEPWSSHSNDPCTITVEGANNRIKLSFHEPFSGYFLNGNRPIALIGQQGNTAQNYDIRITPDGSNTGTDIYIVFYNRGTTTLVNPSTIPNFVYFNVIVVGLDILSDYI